MKKEPVTDEQLKRVKTQIRAQLVRSLDSNSGMAQNLATTKALFGEWRTLFTQLDELDKITAADVTAAAKKYLTAKGRTVGYTVQPPKEEKK